MTTVVPVIRKASAHQASVTDTTWILNLPQSLAANCLILKAECTDTGGNPTITDNKGGTIANGAWGVAVSVVGGKRLCVLVQTNCPAGVNQVTLVYGTATNQFQYDWIEKDEISLLAPTVGNAIRDTGSNSLVNSSPVATSATIGGAGDFVVQFGSNNQNVDNATVFTKGTGFTLLLTQIGGNATGVAGCATTVCQAQIATGAVTPSYSYSGAADLSDTVAIALKSSAGAGTQGAAFRMCGIQEFFIGIGQATMPFQFPHFGTTIHLSDEDENLITGITDGDGNTYGNNGNADRQAMPSTNFVTEHWRANGTTPNSDLRTGSIAFNVLASVNTGFGALYDLIGADATQGAGGRVQAPTTNGNTLAGNANLVTVSINPAAGNIVISSCPIVARTCTGLVSPTAANGGVSQNGFFNAEDGNAGLNNDDCWAYWNVITGGLTSFTYSIQGTGLTGVGEWAAVASEYAPAVPTIARQPGYPQWPSRLGA